MQRRGSAMTPRDARIVVQPVRPHHATEVLEEDSAKCSMLYAPLVDRIPRCLSSRVTTDRYIAAIATSRIRLVAAPGNSIVKDFTDLNRLKVRPGFFMSPGLH